MFQSFFFFYLLISCFAPQKTIFVTGRNTESVNETRKKNTITDKYLSVLQEYDAAAGRYN